MQWAVRKWEPASEYLVIESSIKVIMREFEIKDLPEAPQAHGKHI